MMAIREALYDQINPQHDNFHLLPNVKSLLHPPHNHLKESQRMLDVLKNKKATIKTHQQLKDPL